MTSLMSTYICSIISPRYSAFMSDTDATLNVSLVSLAAKLGSMPSYFCIQNVPLPAATARLVQLPRLLFRSASATKAAAAAISSVIGRSGGGSTAEASLACATCVPLSRRAFTPAAPVTVLFPRP